MYKSLIDKVDTFKNLRVLVVGDYLIDEYVYNRVIGISKEAPIPVNLEESKEHVPGCAGNVVCNLTSLGAQVFATGIIGDDISSNNLKFLLEKNSAFIDYMITDPGRFTGSHSKFYSRIPHVGYQHNYRSDAKNRSKVNEDSEKKLIEIIEKQSKDVDVIVAADYGEENEGEVGILSQKVLEKIAYYAKISVGDSRNYVNRFLNFTYIAPNDNEAYYSIYPKGKEEIEIDEDAINYVGQELLRRLNNKAVVITRGEQGIKVFEQNSKITDVPTKAREMFDVTGAGDTVTAVIALAIASGTDIITASRLANYAASVVIKKPGTATCSIDELKDSISKDIQKGSS